GIGVPGGARSTASNCVGLVFAVGASAVFLTRSLEGRGLIGTARGAIAIALVVALTTIEAAGASIAGGAELAIASAISGLVDGGAATATGGGGFSRNVMRAATHAT